MPPGDPPAAERPVDVLIVSLGATGGLRRADEELLASLRRAGARAELVRVDPPAAVRTLMLTDLRWARAARRAAARGLASHKPRAVIYSSTTAALLWPAPGAIRFDAPAAGNRPGRHGLWQRPLERRRLAQAPLLLPWSEGGLMELRRSVRRRALLSLPARRMESSGRVRQGVDGERALVVPVPVEPSGEHDLLEGVPVDPRTPALRAQRSGTPPPVRDIAAVTYAANPAKKGLDRVLAAWRAARKPGERLLILGASKRELAAAGVELGESAAAGVEDAAGRVKGGAADVERSAAGVNPRAEGIELRAMLPYEEYRAILRRARVFVCAARREDHGLAQLEALADGCMLVSTPSPGPYVALDIARDLDRRLIDDDLGAALRTALDDPLPRYHERALRALAPLRRTAVDRVVAEELLPRLLSSS